MSPKGVSVCGASSLGTVGGESIECALHEGQRDRDDAVSRKSFNYR